MILGVFIEFFGVKIVIGLSKNHCDLILTVRFDLSQNSRYLPIFYRYLPIYLRYFFRNSSTCAREIKVSKFHRYFVDFSDFLAKQFVLGSTDNRYFGRKNRNFVSWLQVVKRLF